MWMDEVSSTLDDFIENLHALVPSKVGLERDFLTMGFVHSNWRN